MEQKNSYEGIKPKCPHLWGYCSHYVGEKTLVGLCDADPGEDIQGCAWTVSHEMEG